MICRSLIYLDDKSFWGGCPCECLVVIHSSRASKASLHGSEDVSTSFAKSNDDYRERMWRARFCFVLRGTDGCAKEDNHRGDSCDKVTLLSRVKAKAHLVTASVKRIRLYLPDV